MIPWPRRPPLGRSAAAEVPHKTQRKSARKASLGASADSSPNANGCRRTASRAKLQSFGYEVVTFFFLLAFFIGLLSLALLVPLAKQSAIAPDCQARS